MADEVWDSAWGRHMGHMGWHLGAAHGWVANRGKRIRGCKGVVHRGLEAWGTEHGIWCMFKG